MSEQFPTTNITIIEQGIMISFNLAVGLSLVASLSDEALFDIAHQVIEARRESKKTDGVIQAIDRNSGKRDKEEGKPTHPFIRREEE